MRSYNPFELFSKQWALVTAGNMEHFNTCTVAWGSLGILWARPGSNGQIVTVYLHPARYTCDFFKECDSFTVSFFPESCRKALSYLGSHSGRDENKVAAAGLTPVAIGETVTFAESQLTFLCRKVYQHQFEQEALPSDVQEYYRSKPQAFPVDENGDWQAHWMFVGEVLDIQENFSAAE